MKRPEKSNVPAVYDRSTDAKTLRIMQLNEKIVELMRSHGHEHIRNNMIDSDFASEILVALSLFIGNYIAIGPFHDASKVKHMEVFFEQVRRTLLNEMYGE